MPELNGITRIIVSGVAGVSAVVGSWSVYSSAFINRNEPLGQPVNGERLNFRSGEFELAGYRFRGSAQQTPVLLIHSINAAASAYEISPLWDLFSKHETVPLYALDLPGFGLSERLDTRYSPQTYIQAITDFVRQKIGRPVHAVAMSLSSEFLAQAAVHSPDLFASVAFLSPSGFGLRNQQGQGPVVESDSPLKTVQFPLWSQPLYDALTTRASIRYFLQQSFNGTVPESFITYDYQASHRPGARFAPLHFISGKLFTRGMAHLYQQLKVPTAVLYDRDSFVEFDLLPRFANLPGWRLIRIPNTAGLPHWEAPQATAEALQMFWMQANSTEFAPS